MEKSNKFCLLTFYEELIKLKFLFKVLFLKSVIIIIKN